MKTMAIFSTNGFVSISLEQEVKVVNKAVNHCHNFDCNGQNADWLDTPEDVLLCIADKFIDGKDIIRFGAVCHLWRLVFNEKRASGALSTTTSRQIPMLLVSTESNDNHNTRSLYNTTEKRVFKSEVYVPHNLHCAGCSHGWLVTISKDYQICLLNPFIAVDNEIVLPPLTSFTTRTPGAESEYYRRGFLGFLEKVVLSANPVSNPNFIALACYGCNSRMAYFKPGSNAWTSLSSDYVQIFDMIYYENRFYAASRRGPVYILDFNPPCPVISTLDASIVESHEKRYLVESSGDLLQVIRETNFDEDDMSNYFNNGFDVYKLDRIGKCWNKITKLRGHALYLGLNTSISILASDFPGCSPDCIYFTDDYVQAWRWGRKNHTKAELHDMGVFNIEDRSTQQHYPATKRMVYAPIWIQPTL